MNIDDHDTAIEAAGKSDATPTPAMDSPNGQAELIAYWRTMTAALIQLNGGAAVGQNSTTSMWTEEQLKQLLAAQDAQTLAVVEQQVGAAGMCRNAIGDGKLRVSGDESSSRGQI